MVASFACSYRYEFAALSYGAVACPKTIRRLALLAPGRHAIEVGGRVWELRR